MTEPGDILPDVLAPGLTLVFCGTAPSRASARARAYYGNPANRFWPTLRQTGLVPPDFRAQDYATLPRYGLGLTDMAKQRVGNDDELAAGDFDRERFICAMTAFRPAAVAFTSKRAASACLLLPTRRIAYGWQPAGPVGLALYVLPSPSGAATSYWDVRWWQALADWVRTQPGARVYKTAPDSA